VTNRFFHLLSRLQRLDEALRLERYRPAPDVTRLWKLALMKGRIKGRLARLMKSDAVLATA